MRPPWRANRLAVLGRAATLLQRATSSEEIVDRLLELLVEDGAALAILRQVDAEGRATTHLRCSPAADPAGLGAMLDADLEFSLFCEGILHELAALGESRVISAPPEAGPQFGALAAASGAATAIAAPLIQDGPPPGLLLILGTSGGGSVDDVRPFVDAFARQAALALDNARLRAEARAARDDLARQINFIDAIAHDIAEGILAMDRGGRITYLNPVAEEMLGWSIKDVLGRVAHDVVHPPDPSGAVQTVGECPVQDVFKAGRTIHLDDLTFCRSDGSTFPGALSASPLFRDGEIVGAAVVFRDVTKERESSEQLRQSEERLRRALAAARMMTWDRDLTTGRTIRSDLAAAMYGRPNDELLDDEDLPSRFLHPEDRERVFASNAEAMRTGETQALEYRVVWPDGSVRWIARRGQVFHDESGRPVRMSGTAMDITDRKVAELHLARLLELRKSEAAELQALQQRLRRSLDAVLGLHEVGKLLTSARDPKAAGRRLLEIAVRAASLEAASISLRDRRGSVRNWQRVDRAGRPRGRRRPDVVTWARADALASGTAQSYVLQPGRDGQPPRLGWCVPLVVQDRVIGVLEAVGQMDLSGEPTAEILSSIAAQAASALENSRLYRDVAERERALRRLVHQLMSAQEEERRRLALEMHDEVAQMATATQRVIEAFALAYRPDSGPERAHLETAVDLARQTMDSIRRVLAGLRPALLDDLGLARGLAALAASLRADGLDVAYRASFDVDRLPPETEIALFRAAQEALTNVRKHAGTTRAELRLTGARGRVVLEVRDQGRGFDPDLVDGGEAIGNRLGLLGMRERIAQIGGTFDLVSRPGEGTRVRIVAPLGGPGSERGDRSGAPR